MSMDWCWGDGKESVCPCLKWREDLEVREEAGVGCQHSQTDMFAFETPFSTQEGLTCHKIDVST